MSLRGPDRPARLRALGAAPALLLALGLACSGAAGPARSARPGRGEVVHVVRPGETLWRISQHYGVPVEAVVRANGIRDVRDVAVGTRLRIPHPRDPAGARPVPPPPAELPAPRPEELDRSVRELGLAFGWPLRGPLNSHFGGRGFGQHEGIDIAARKGTPIHAAEAGRVIFAEELGDYGKVVIVKHLGAWSTVYAHNRRNRVRRGQFVEKGELLAEVGSTGNASGPHVHFEIRRGQTAVDPLRYLP